MPKSSHSALVQSFLEDPNTMKMRKMEGTSFHVAMLMKRGKVLEVASNQIGSRSRGCGYAEYTIHAEKNVIKQLGDISKLKGADMYIMRFTRNSKRQGMDQLMNSEPCRSCQVFLEKCVREYGLKNVYYTA